LCKEGTTDKISILQEKQDDDSVLHTTDILIGYATTALVILEDGIVIFHIPQVIDY